MEILAKFGSALSGFWWALDEQERRYLILGVCYVLATVGYLGCRERDRQRELDELADRVAERLNG